MQNRIQPANAATQERDMLAAILLGSIPPHDHVVRRVGRPGAVIRFQQMLR